jgi:shikimate dehydrogenase
MYPHIDDELLVNLKDFKNLLSVMDVIYNPLRTRLIIESERLGIKSVSGLYMLVAQAYFASQLFLHRDTNITNDNIIDKLLSNSDFENNTYINQCTNIYKKCLGSKQNIVLSGMPTCGKTTLGKLVSKMYGYEFIDTDELIEKKINCKIVDYINKYGEETFRDIESEVIKNISSKNHLIISTGGGAILRDKNVVELKTNGKIFFINRSLKLLKPSSSRPLTSDIESLTKKYNERIPIYKSTCDFEINGDNELDIKVDDILRNII